MGCAWSDPDKNHQDTSKAIEKQIRQDAEKAMKEVKLLLLGAGECGKSTVLKQMKIIHGEGYKEEERKEYVCIIFANIVQSMIKILKAMESLEIVPDTFDPEEEVKKLNGYLVSVEDGVFPEELAKLLHTLWETPSVQKCFSRAKEYQLNDSAGYYIQSLDRISAPGYTPTEQDVLRSRVKTTGIVETNFRFKDLDFKVFDVGGGYAKLDTYEVHVRWSTVGEKKVDALFRGCYRYFIYCGDVRVRLKISRRSDNEPNA
ncbi:unnamed protein product [Dicrocoelium dendriticum]|nr:unnamed protein product [Dicrocoelium dendriticum]